MAGKTWKIVVSEGMLGLMVSGQKRCIYKLAGVSERVRTGDIIEIRGASLKSARIFIATLCEFVDHVGLEIISIKLADER